ncbi:MAG TPA: peptidyl-prolyl cis-trans isomerase, partial [Spirochaetia bacterium]|nr:peptidyl-prolyl cis-trans isomerase [Spirochaetia bacterium]
DRLAAQVRQRSGQNQNTEAMVEAVWYQAFQQTAMHVAVLLMGEKAGLQVSDDAIDRALVSYPGYLDENGKFSEERYNKASGQEKAATRKLYRENLLSSQIATDILTSVKTSSKESAFIVSMVKPERSFQFVSFPFSSFPPEEVRKYGEANASLFRKIKVSRILIKSSEAEASQIRLKIAQKTSTFEELAKTYSKDAYADKGGDMGWRYAYDLRADFENKDTASRIFSLKAGEISDVLKGTFGWMVYRCDAEALNPDFSNPNVLDDVKGYLAKYEKGKIEDYFNGQALRLSRRSGEIGFDKAAAEAGHKVTRTDFFPVNLQNVFSFVPVQAIPETATPSNAVYSDEFFYRAFSLGKDQPSAPVVLDDQILVLKLLGERQMPDTTVNLLGGWIDYVASQSAQVDLTSALMAPGKLKDNFEEVFSQSVAPRRQ